VTLSKLLYILTTFTLLESSSYFLHSNKAWFTANPCHHICVQFSQGLQETPSGAGDNPGIWKLSE